MKILEFVFYCFNVYYDYVAVCCIWYVIEFFRRPVLETLSLPDEMMVRLTLGLVNENV